MPWGEQVHPEFAFTTFADFVDLLLIGMLGIKRLRITSGLTLLPNTFSQLLLVFRSGNCRMRVQIPIGNQPMRKMFSLEPKLHRNTF